MYMTLKQALLHVTRKRGPVEEPPKVFVLSYVCLNVYKYCVN